MVVDGQDKKENIRHVNNYRWGFYTFRAEVSYAHKTPTNPEFHSRITIHWRIYF